MSIRMHAVSMVLFCALNLGADLQAAENFGLFCQNVNSPIAIINKKDALYVSQFGGAVSLIENGRQKEVFRDLPCVAGMAHDGRGNIYMAGYANGNIYKWDGKSDPEVFASGFNAPTGLLWEEGSGLLVANRNSGEIVLLDAKGDKSIISRNHNFPVGIARTASGDLFISCYGGQVDILAKEGGRLSVSQGLSRPGVGIVPAANDSVYVVDNGAGKVVELNRKGIKAILASGLAQPVALANQDETNLLVGCWGSNSLITLHK